MSTERRVRAAAPAGDYSLEDQVGHLLRRAYQRAAENLAARLAPHELTPMQFAVMARLREAGAVSQNRLGRLVAMEPANIRDTVGRLIRRGLLRAGRDPRDRRLILLSLSRSGAALVEELVPLSRAATAASLAPLSESERATLYRLLRKLL